ISSGFVWQMAGASVCCRTGPSRARTPSSYVRCSRPLANASIPPLAQSTTPPTATTFMWIWGYGGCADNRLPLCLTLRQKQIGRLAAAAVGEVKAAELGDFVVGTQGNLYVTRLQVDGAH